jgi:hypothetical protein
MAGVRADNAATHYSPLTDITGGPDIVARLTVAWEWSPGRAEQAGVRHQPGNFQNTPLMIDNVLYVSTMYNRVVALDADSGKELWSYDPKAYEDGQPPNGTGFVHRGVAAWRDRGSRAERPDADLSQQPLASARARREDRRADHVLRRQRRRRSHAGFAARGESQALHEYVSAGRLQESRHSRKRCRRSAGLQG